MILQRTSNVIKRNRKDVKKWIENTKNLDFYKGETQFIDNNILELNGKKITGKNIIIATGVRPLIPEIKGIEKCDYLTNETVI